MIELSVGQPYPLPINFGEGGALPLLDKDAGHMQIALGGMTKDESRSLRKGKMLAGLYVDNPVIVFVFSFPGVIDIDCPFDARMIPRDQLLLPDITNKLQRLFFDIHIVDSSTMILKGIRGITLPADLTLSFLQAVQDQLTSNESFSGNYAKWQAVPLTQHLKNLKLQECGKDG